MLALTVMAGAVLYLDAEHRLGHFGFPLDDAWIHAQFARNLAHGHGLSFNPGEPSTGSTAPLWTWIWALPIALGADTVVAGKVLGVIAAIAAALLTFELTRALARSDRAGALAGFAVALSPRLAWGAVSGMEVPLYTALVAATLMVFMRVRPGRDWQWGALAGLSTLARPETGVLFPILAMVSVIRRLTSMPRDDGSSDGSGVEPWAPLLGATVAFAIVVGADIVVNLWLSGKPLPATFYAKTEGAGLLNGLAHLDFPEAWRSLTSRPLDALNQVIRYCVEQSTLFFLFGLMGLLALANALREAPDASATPSAGAAVAALLIAGPLAMGSVAPVSPILMQEGRYVAHLLIAYFVVAAVGVAATAKLTRWPSAVWALAFVALLRLASQDAAFAARYGLQVDNINRMHVAMGNWLASHTAADAIVATNDIGAIAYVSGRRILDLEGLTTPEILPFKTGRCQLEYLRRRKPDFVVIFDEWYPQLAARTDLLTEVHRITVPRVTAAHDTFKAYRASWTDAAADDRCGARAGAGPPTP